MVGEIHIRFGSMYAGKSSYLKTIAYRNFAINKKVCIINSKCDTRIEKEGIKTHDGHFIPGIKPYSDTTEKLTGYCEICQDFTPGIFTKAKFTETVKENEVKVGGKDLYISVCRKHLLKTT